MACACSWVMEVVSWQPSRFSCGLLKAFGVAFVLMWCMSGCVMADSDTTAAFFHMSGPAPLGLTLFRTGQQFRDAGIGRIQSLQQHVQDSLVELEAAFQRRLRQLTQTHFEQDAVGAGLYS